MGISYTSLEFVHTPWGIFFLNIAICQSALLYFILIQHFASTWLFHHVSANVLNRSISPHSSWLLYCVPTINTFRYIFSIAVTHWYVNQLLHWCTVNLQKVWNLHKHNFIDIMAGIDNRNISDNINDKSFCQSCAERSAWTCVTWLCAPGSPEQFNQSNQRKYDINPSPPCAAHTRQWIGSALIQIMACRLFCAKPLSEPMLDYC